MEGAGGGVGELGGVEGLEAVVSHLDVVLDLRLMRLGLWVSCRYDRYGRVDEPQLRVSGVCVVHSRQNQRARSTFEVT